jgi:hypothetical protein
MHLWFIVGNMRVYIYVYVQYVLGTGSYRASSVMGDPE